MHSHIHNMDTCRVYGINVSSAVRIHYTQPYTCTLYYVIIIIIYTCIFIDKPFETFAILMRHKHTNRYSGTSGTEDEKCLLGRSA